MKESELLEKILERPALYVGKPSIPLIYTFIQGYTFAKSESKEVIKDNLYAGFNAWVAKRFKIQPAHNWSNIVVFMGQGENGAYELTKELWTEYKENKK